MAQQLIYTSCPVSLVRGRSGFSTVARGAGMGEALASMVERCSSYDSSAVSGPVFSHRIVRCGSSNWHVLTRTCDCGTDYTNRNNYIAHHLVLSEEEAAGLACNSAQIMLYWDGWLDSWSGEPRYIDDVDLSGIPAPAELPARRWEKIFSDAGCAACLSESGGEVLFWKRQFRGFPLEGDFRLQPAAQARRCGFGFRDGSGASELQGGGVRAHGGAQQHREIQPQGGQAGVRSA